MADRGNSYPGGMTGEEALKMGSAEFSKLTFLVGNGQALTAAELVEKAEQRKAREEESIRAITRAMKEEREEIAAARAAAGIPISHVAPQEITPVADENLQCTDEGDIDDFFKPSSPADSGDPTPRTMRGALVGVPLRGTGSTRLNIPGQLTPDVWS